MLAWHLAAQLAERSITVNAANPGCNRLDEKRGWARQGPGSRDESLGANAPRRCGYSDLACSDRDMEGVTAKFWSKRHEIACKFRDPSQIDELVTLTAQQIGSRIR